METLTELFKKKPYLTWYIKDKTNLSEKSMLEHILNYGTWQDYQVAESAMGLPKVKTLFKELVQGKRVNLRPQTENYFSKYLQKYA